MPKYRYRGPTEVEPDVYHCDCRDRHGALKKSYPTREDAIFVIDTVKRNTGNKSLRAYPCPRSLNWHISSD